MKPNWREGILYTVTLLMESCWLGALLLFLNELVANGRQLSIIWLWLLYPAAFLLNWLLHRLGWTRYRYYAINGLAFALGTLLLVKTQLYAGYSLLDTSWLSALGDNISQVFQAFHPEVLAIIGCGLLFWRGWHLAHHRATFTAVGTSLQFGLSILLIVLFLSHLTGVSVRNAILLVIAFSFLALIGIGLSRSKEVAAEQTGASTQGPQLLVASAGLILLLGLFIGSFITSDLLHALLDILRWVWGIILKVIVFLLSLLPEPGPAELPPPLPTIPHDIPQEAFHPWMLPERVRDIGGKLTMLVFAILIAIALYQMFSDIWHRLRGTITRGATIEPLPRTLRTDLLAALTRLIHRVLGILFRWRLAHRHRRVTESQSQEVSSIRHIYRSLIRWGTEAGWPRRVNETPYEYLETLGTALPTDGQSQLSCITEAYVRARYGQNWKSSEPLPQIKESWERLRRFRLKKADQRQTLNDTNCLQEVQNANQSSSGNSREINQ